MNKFIKIPLILAAITFLSSGLLMFSENATRFEIEKQKKLVLLNSLKDLIPAHFHNNNLINDAQIIYKPQLLGHRKPHTLYLGKQDSRLSVMAIPVTTQNGYSGDIDLMVGVKSNGQITSVKILEQHETPGLGDLVEASKSDWLKQFPTLSLNAISDKNWNVKRDGGQFDQITGATVTPRAIVAAIKQALIFQQQYTEQNTIKGASK